MNGKLVVRLVEAALAGKQEQVRIIANLLSHEIREIDPETSKSIAKLVASPMRTTSERINPHLLNKKSEGSFLLNDNQDNWLMDELILSDENQNIINQIIDEHKNIIKLKKFDLEPTKTILFKGPPGVGKTLTARWLAKEIGLPLRVLDLASVMSSLLGKTGNNIREVFDDAAKSPCVLLLDEFDSVAKKRDDEQDIGELKRLVTVLLQSIDSWPSSSLLIAATNHADLLDKAIWRRFELKLNFDNPNEEQIQRFVFSITKDKSLLNMSFIFNGLSFSDIKTEINNNKRISVLKGVKLSDQLLSSFMMCGEYKHVSLDEKKKIAYGLVMSGMSQRKVSELLSMARPTIKKTLEEMRDI